jgi:hypothetical protein
MAIRIEERLARLSAWWRRENDRPLIAFTVGSYYPLHRYPRSVASLPNGEVTANDVQVAAYLEDTERLYQLHEEAGGDFVFAAAPFLGLPWVEASLGCGVIADHRAGSTRSTAPPGFAKCPHIPRFSEDDRWVAKMLEFIPALERLSAGRYPVGVTLMRGISDLLSALYGADAFVLRLLDDPVEVDDVVHALTEYWIAFGRCLLRHLPRFHGGTGSFFYSLWSPGELIWLQEDAVALLSPSLYERFILPADRRIAETFERSVIHLHPTRVLPTAPLLNTPISAIEIHIDHGGPSAESLQAHYRAILERKPLLVWGDLSDADLEFILSSLPGRGLAVNVVVPGIQEARRIWKLCAGLVPRLEG